MLKSFILDDETHAIDLLTDYIGRTPDIELIGADTNPLNALRKITELAPDILFLDIDMPEISGLEFMKLLGTKIHIVFTTGHTEYAIEGYNRDIADYLLKPISYSRFNTCCERLIQKIAYAGKKGDGTKTFFYIQGDNKAKMIKINMDELFYVQSLNNYVIIYHQSDKLITYLTMKEVEQFLPSDRFSRIHKSYLVNDSKIKTIESGHVILHSQPVTALPIGLKYREQFFSKIRKVTLKRGDVDR
ncbi:LytR/AlgR family response regulator transcription factor [Mucilaginibacter polytrichastri]|uniref:Response regulatory domain-containing protein n=1 Tax=Mucilaginibacter polytrichastri TaxID=1302689 RepID=A0A1Q6A3T0_9SPHI|nr:LytTR family DNA-binding domain-containing protein [Mucilaginibacter polytrichastri]OKS88665.1 hypothetical protein RG47T_4137 [Mucilaginibacter polytrichastri]SFT26538.1 two component transcriptional regulator, LytTR family [Mucilaginibacter polytrichastri]